MVKKMWKAFFKAELALKKLMLQGFFSLNNFVHHFNIKKNCTERGNLFNACEIGKIDQLINTAVCNLDIMTVNTVNSCFQNGFTFPGFFNCSIKVG